MLDHTVTTLVESHATSDQDAFDGAVATLAEIVHLSSHPRPAPHLISSPGSENQCVCGRDLDSLESRIAHQRHCVTFKLAALDAIEASLAEHDQQAADDQPWWQS